MVTIRKIYKISSQIIAMMLGPRLTLEDFDWEEKMWKEIYNRAIDKEKVVRTIFEPFTFEYALINPSDEYGRSKKSKDGMHYQYTGKNVTYWIKKAEKKDQIGFNQGRLAFVFERSLPRRDFADYVGMHEWAESRSIVKGDINVDIHNRIIHGKGCKMELEFLLMREKEFVDEYANWLVNLTKFSKKPEDSYMPRAIPEFLEIIKEEKLSPTEIVREFKNQLDNNYYLNNFSILKTTESEHNL